MTLDGQPLVVPVAANGSEWVSFKPGGAGWAAVRSPVIDAEQAWCFVRFGLAEDAPPGVAAVLVKEVLVSFAVGVGPRVMRDLPLARVEAAVNQPAYRPAVFEHLPNANAVMIPFPWQGASDWWFATSEPRRRPRLKLRVPEGRGRPDAFYEQVAERFTYLATVSPRPATELAEANGVKVTTVHGWVKEARRRGLLPAGERHRRRGKGQS